MKKIIQLLLYFIFLNNSITFGQKVYKDFLDGEVYIKIKNDIPFVFDALHRNIAIRTKLPFLVPLISKYNITKADASFYFSKSDILKRTFRIHFTKSALTERFIAELKNLNEIEYAEKVPLMNFVYIPNDLQPNQIPGQYGLYNIHAQQAWDVSRGNHSVEVAIVDNAIEFTHQDLSANIANQWDVSDDDADPRPPNFNVDWWHGTHTSGIACASTNNSTGVASIGFNSGLMAVKATSDDNDGDAVDHGFEGIDWAVSNGAKVISCSWGNYSYSETGQNTIDNAYNNNVVVVAAAGNDNTNTMFYPAAYNHVVAVAAVDNADMKSSYSNYGSWVDVSAPGDFILSTIPNNQYDALSGTSMATPFVAGLCGLIRSVNPGLSYDQVVSALVNNTDNINAQNPLFIGQLGSGRINAYRAVENALICNPAIHLGTDILTTPKTESSDRINSANTIPAGAQVWLDATTLINLLPGFIATNGSVFRAYIDGCGNNFIPNYYNKSKSVPSTATNTNAKENIKSVDILSPSLINIVPNPFINSFVVSINSENNQKAYIVIYNSVGTKVRERSNILLVKGLNKIFFDAPDLAQGVYMVEINFGNTKSVKKIVKI